MIVWWILDSGLVQVADNWSAPINNFHFLCLSPQICERLYYHHSMVLMVSLVSMVSWFRFWPVSIVPLVSLVSKSGQAGNSIAVAKNHQPLPGLKETDHM